MKALQFTLLSCAILCVPVVAAQEDSSFLELGQIAANPKATKDDRTEALRQLIEAGPRARPASGLVIATLSDSDWELRLDAVYALENMVGEDGWCPPSIVPALRTALTDPSLLVRSAALGVVETLGPSAEGLRSEVISTLTGGRAHQGEKLSAVWALSSLGLRDGQCVLSSLEADERAVREEVVIELAQIGSPSKEVVEALLLVANTDTKDVVTSAHNTLAALHAKDPQALRRALHSADWDVRRMATFELDRLEPAFRTEDTLLDLLTDPVPEVQYSVLLVLESPGEGWQLLPRLSLRLYGVHGVLYVCLMLVWAFGVVRKVSRKCVPGPVRRLCCCLSFALPCLLTAFVCDRYLSKHWVEALLDEVSLPYAANPSWTILLGACVSCVALMVAVWKSPQVAAPTQSVNGNPGETLSLVPYDDRKEARDSEGLSHQEVENDQEPV